MRIIFPLLFAAPVLAFAQGSASCVGAPADAITAVPSVISQWLTVECGEFGHVLSPAPGYRWRANSNGRALDFPALGLGRIPANNVDGIPLVVGRTGAYPPLLGGKLMSPHDAFFSKSQLTLMEGELLNAANVEASKQAGYAGPYSNGFLFDVLSNQGFQYRVYILAKDAQPHMVLAFFEAPRQHRKQVTLLVTKQ
ncbi:hypothetical protein [Polaromonas sp.]|uniref:hypothetical protein n=1 Tax=Polaromonas sp. TaxID=1869339 RepID=UPI003C8F1A19